MHLNVSNILYWQTSPPPNRVTPFVIGICYCYLLLLILIPTVLFELISSFNLPVFRLPPLTVRTTSLPSGVLFTFITPLPLFHTLRVENQFLEFSEEQQI